MCLSLTLVFTSTVLLLLYTTNSYVIINNQGEVLRKLPKMDTDRAKAFGEEIFQLASKARHVVRDLNPAVRQRALVALLTILTTHSPYTRRCHTAWIELLATANEGQGDHGGTRYMQ